MLHMYALVSEVCNYPKFKCTSLEKKVSHSVAVDVGFVPSLLGEAASTITQILLWLFCLFTAQLIRIAVFCL